ncbi:preprotein translocase subunit YajC [Arthrobacter sp. H14-L1]|uniref:preprotein translocase subunit YajC n=1 Tax=Arthrobacter sp. H14-L1 TaxID=2996697 RepID=UPI0022702AD9|nr:preprotein translocase subunit YajC [Arthrobacter sp. H14-L1]MCY0903797.1 preprotein translocase subunit YajC [Arthrobacter sp. H14-L1]
MFTSILAADQPQAGGFDPMTLILFALFAVVILMMFRRQKKAKAAQQEQQAKLATGVAVMTNFGLFGTVLSIDDAENKVVLELSPGNTATVHRQTITKITAPVQNDSAVPDDASSLMGMPSDGQADPHPRAYGDAGAGNVSESADETILRLNKDNKNDN